jgi:group II intron reverse transcriptase/maturase
LRSVEPRQLCFAFADSPEGGGEDRSPGRPGGREFLLQTASTRKATGSTATAASGLLEEVASPQNLARALLHVARKKGAGGVDGQSVDEVVEVSHRLLPRLRGDLLSGRYQPGDVRRVWIPKPGGGRRGLGIPNVVDRWVQQAVHQVLMPLFEPTFHRSSHGFRPGRGAGTAIAEARGYVAAGGMTVVSIDLSKFFDRVHHQRLLARVGQRVDDPRVLRLIHRMLKAKVVMPDGTRVASDEGTPQGGPLSPLLSNIVLDELDWELERRGLRFVRYADDFNVFVGSRRAGERVMASLIRFITRRLRLQVNEDKSDVTRPEDLHILGFSLQRGSDGSVEVLLSERSRKRMNAKIRELTPRSLGRPLEVCIERINGYLEDWYSHFRLCTLAAQRSFGNLDAHIRRRLRAIVVRQRKRPRYLFRHLVKRGVTVRTAARCAWCDRGTWYKSNHAGMTRAYPNAWFHARLFSLLRALERHLDGSSVTGQPFLPGLEIPT